MSGAEASAVLGLIGSIVSIVDGTQKVYDAAKNVEGLPKAFREVKNRLPIIRNILGSAEQYIKNGDLDENSCKGVKNVIESCEKKATKLDELFSEAISPDGTSDVKRYWAAVKACGKGNKVEKLMEGMLRDVQLLANQHDMKIATKDQIEEIVNAIKVVSAVEPSVPGNMFQETGVTIDNSGYGTQNNAWGEHIAQGYARQYNSAGGTMTFGKD